MIKIVNNHAMNYSDIPADLNALERMTRRATTTMWVDENAEKARVRARIDATRHSGHVKILRIVLIVFCCLGPIGVVLFSLYDPFRMKVSGVEVGRLGLEGTKITMSQPKMKGFRKDGRAYEIQANAGVQDVLNPTILELTGVDARIAMADRSNARVEAPSGTYESKAEWMDLRSNAQEMVRITSDAGYSVIMSNTRMDFKSGTLTSDYPVEVHTKNGQINADSVQVKDNGRLMIFEKNVRTVFQGDDPQPHKDHQLLGNP
jgi:lipopolysaccharide export system protein LptC